MSKIVITFFPPRRLQPTRQPRVCDRPVLRRVAERDSFRRARRRVPLFPAYYHRPEAKLLLVIFFVIAWGRKQLIVKKCIFARGRRIFHYTFLTSPVGEKTFR